MNPIALQQPQAITLTEPLDLLMAHIPCPHCQQQTEVTALAHEQDPDRISEDETLAINLIRYHSLLALPNALATLLLTHTPLHQSSLQAPYELICQHCQGFIDEGPLHQTGGIFSPQSGQACHPIKRYRLPASITPCQITACAIAEQTELIPLYCPVTPLINA